MVDGISVLIPCYRYDPAPLVEALLPQLEEVEGLQWEIIVGNDHSGAQWLETFEALEKRHEKVRVVEPEQNLGRAAIRNFMARHAACGSLLFIDADSLPGSRKFIQTYLDNRQKADVLVGGTAYKPFPGCSDNLRFRYGIKREAIPAGLRNRQPFHRVALNNVMARRDVWMQIPLNEAIIGYGHEDTYWGLALEWAGKSILHLDNAVYHTGLEYNETFVTKCKESAANLAELVRIGLIPAESSRLAKTGEKVLGMRVGKAVMLALRIARPKLVQVAAQAGRFSLRALDLLKLDAYLIARTATAATEGQT